MSYVLDILSFVFLAGGAFFCVLGGVGLLRLRGFYARTHPASMIDTMGAGMILLGLCFQATSWIVAVKLVIIFLLIVITSPTAAHALVKAAYAHGVRVGDEVPRIGAHRLPAPPSEEAEPARAEHAEQNSECERVDNAN